MTKEQEEAIKYFEDEIKVHRKQIDKLKEEGKFEGNGTMIDIYKLRICMITIILNMLKEKDAEIEKKDNAVKRIINRLDNDIKRITETKRDKSTFPNYLDDYTKCRLKAYRTKTKEIKEYIEEQYFEIKATNDG